MKLLYCDLCGDIFNLKEGVLKTCSCGEVKGMYVNNWEAVSNGKGHSIAIGNGSFMNALRGKCTMEYNASKDEQLVYDRKDYQKNCRVDYCWFRPNDGEGNPHSKIDENL